MIGCLRTRVRKQPINALYFKSEIGLKFYKLEARIWNMDTFELVMWIRFLGYKMFFKLNSSDNDINPGINVKSI